MLLALLISSNVFILPSLRPPLRPPKIPTTKPPVGQIPSEDSRPKTEQERELLAKYLRLEGNINSTLSNEVLDFSTKKVVIQKLIEDIQKSSAKISDKTLKEINADSLIKYRNMQPQDIEKMIIEANVDSTVKLLIERNIGEKTFLIDTQDQIQKLKEKKATSIKEIDKDIEIVIRDQIDSNVEDLMKPLMEPFIKEMRNRLETALFRIELTNFKTHKQSISKEDQDIMSKYLEDLALNITPSDKDSSKSILKKYRDLAQARAQKERATLAKAKKSLADVKKIIEGVSDKDPQATKNLQKIATKDAKAKVKEAQEIVDARKAADKARFNKKQQEKKLADTNQRKQRAAEAERLTEAERLEEERLAGERSAGLFD